MGRVEFVLPDVGEGLEEGEIVSWLVAPGDTVTRDQPLVEVQTDKALVELPSPVGGQVVSLAFGPGDIVKVGQVLVVLEDASPPAAAMALSAGPPAGPPGVRHKAAVAPPADRPPGVRRPLRRSANWPSTGGSTSPRSPAAGPAAASWPPMSKPPLGLASIHRPRSGRWTPERTRPQPACLSSTVRN